MHTSRLLTYSSVLLTLWATTKSSFADVVYSTGSFTADSDGNRLISDYDYAPSPGGVQIAGTFTLPGSAEVTSLQWWGQYLPANTHSTQDSFVIQLFSNFVESGSGFSYDRPGNVPLYQSPAVLVSSMPTGVDSSGAQVYAYSATLPSSVNLLGATKYWLSIIDDTTSDSDDDWNWQRASLTRGVFAERLITPGGWGIVDSAGAPAFVLQGTVGPVAPEPATAALFSIGLLSFAAIRRRRQTSHYRA